MLSGRPSLVHGRAVEPGDVIEMDREQMLALVQTDAELSEIIMRAFILRRVALVARGSAMPCSLVQLTAPARSASRNSSRGTGTLTR